MKWPLYVAGIKMQTHGLHRTVGSSEPLGTSWKPLESFEIFQNINDFFGTLRILSEPYRTFRILS